jgi:3-dehydroquinate dehydratase/shikimate dehydrogenase
MNNGKICVSVCASTPLACRKQIAAAAPYADIVEIRFDAFEKEYIATAASIRDAFEQTTKGFKNIEFVITFRPAKEGGLRLLSKEDRFTFWNSGITSDYCDRETDIAGKTFDSDFKTIIVSAHDFDGESNASLLAAKVASHNPSISKIAIKADDAVDGLEVWNLLNSEDKPVVPIAMGNAGKWTRILGPAFGVPLTYASPDQENIVAPGQVSARDLDELYRVKHLNRETEIYGIVGGSTEHSISPYLQNAGFAEAGLDAVYVPFEVSNLGAFVKRMVRPATREIDWNIRGFSVTNPHKESIIKYLDFVDPTAKEIGAVNTVQVVENQLVGFNTDADGFIEPLLASYGDLKGVSVAVFGAGGAARACLWALLRDGAKPAVFARDTSKAAPLAEEFECQLFGLDAWQEHSDRFSIAVNTTPLGTIGANENKSILAAGQIKNLQMIYDLVYNPIETRFLREAKRVKVSAIGGFAMLTSQGAKQFEIWTGTSAPVNAMSRAALSTLK